LNEHEMRGISTGAVLRCQACFRHKGESIPSIQLIVACHFTGRTAAARFQPRPGGTLEPCQPSRRRVTSQGASGALFRVVVRVPGVETPGLLSDGPSGTCVRGNDHHMRPIKSANHKAPPRGGAFGSCLKPATSRSLDSRKLRARGIRKRPFGALSLAFARAPIGPPRSFARQSAPRSG
jgi:hypothetical protein